MPKRTIRVELHAMAADLAGAGSADLQVEADATGDDVKRALAALHPALEEILSVSALATEVEYLHDSARVGDSARFHLVPPVSGG